MPDLACGICQSDTRFIVVSGRRIVRARSWYALLVLSPLAPDPTLFEVLMDSPLITPSTAASHRVAARGERIRRGSRSAYIGIGVNLVLACVKGTGGVLGHSYALIADAIESLTDVLSSLIVILGLRVAAAPPSSRFPYGRGRAETMAGIGVSLILLLAAAGIAVESVRQIRTPHELPRAWTLGVLVAVVVVKETLFRFVIKEGDAVGSAAVKADAWHHRSDAITSVAVFIGIVVALIGGKGYESADDWAALFASGIIALNGLSLLMPALSDLLDRAPDEAINAEIRRIATSVPGVLGTHTVRVRKLGLDFYVDLDILVPGDMSVRESHAIAHVVQDAIRAEVPIVWKVLIHVEPAGERGGAERERAGRGAASREDRGEAIP